MKRSDAGLPPEALDPIADHFGVCRWCGAPDAVEGTTCPRSIECPHCHAAPGSPCKRPSGHRAPAMHSSRVLSAEQEDFKAGVGPDPATLRYAREPRPGERELPPAQY